MARLIGAALLLFGAGCLFPRPAEGRIEQIVVPISGMTCALCARGVEEAMRRLDRVSEASADLETGTVRVVALRDKSLDLDEVKGSVVQAGFEVGGECRLVAAGGFSINPAGRIVFRIRDASQTYRVFEGNRLLDLFRAHPGLEGEFVVEFHLHRDPRWNPPGITILGFRPASAPATAAAK